MSVYLIINAAAVMFPLAASFEKRIAFYRKWPALFPAILLTAAVFLIGDHLFTVNGIWGFNDAYLSGRRVWALPVEEILFFVCIPYACVFIYECVKWRWPRVWNESGQKRIQTTLAVVLIGFWLISGQGVYTTTVCLGGSVLLLLSRAIPFAQLGYFHLTFLICLIPFFIVNGILTSGIGAVDPAPVVWYNPDAFSGWRLGTIPVEDVFYCYFLLLINIQLYETFLTFQRSR